MRHNDKLKVIGLFIMLVDHVALFLFGGWLPLYQVARVIGFPFFAYGVAVGALHTSRPWLYLRRLFWFAVLCQPLFYYATDFPRLNVVFTLCLGASAVVLWRSGSLPWRLVALLLCVVGGSWSDPLVGYGAYGVASVFFFSLGPWVALFFHFFAGLWFLDVGDWQFLAGLSLLFIYLLPAPSLRLPRWVFYASYPGHLAVIAGIKKFIFPLFLY